MEERRRGSERGHLRTSGDIWPPFKGQVGPSFGSYNLQPILVFLSQEDKSEVELELELELELCKH